MIAERFAAQLLSGPPAADATSVAHRLLAVQGQDSRGVRLAIRARSTGLSAADVDRALTDDRVLLITWLNRGTLHLVRSEDYFWLHAITTPQLLRGNARRLAQEGVAPDVADRGVGVIERSLYEAGPLIRGQLGERLRAADVPVAGQALIHLLALASLRGLTVRGPVVAGQQAYVLVRDWLGRPPAVDRDTAGRELARRYLAGHGPAGERDLARWAGVPLRVARAGLTAIAAELVERPDGLVALAGRPASTDLPPPRLLGAFDPLLLGWCSREAILGANQGAVTVNGVFRPFALVGGRGAATWTLPGGRVVLHPFGRLSAADRAALDADAVDVVRFLGLAR
ncbi:MAG: winged helix DNA-binding domain-containing protein [Actinomycetota bacterium]|nr:winged helix DNA-binding domain-containing protein [Actinomycetota bacterium]